MSCTASLSDGVVSFFVMLRSEGRGLDPLHLLCMVHVRMWFRSSIKNAVVFCSVSLRSEGRGLNPVHLLCIGYTSECGVVSP